MEQLSPYTTTTETVLHKRSHCNEKPVHSKKKVDPLAPKKKRKAHAQ